MYQIEKVFIFANPDKPKWSWSDPHSEKEYEIGYLLQLVEDAESWDQVVLESSFTPSRIVRSLAADLELESSGLEEKDIFEAVKDELEVEGEKIRLYHYDYDTHTRVYNEKKYYAGYLYRLIKEASSWGDEVLPAYTSLDVLMCLVSACDLWPCLRNWETVEDIFQYIESHLSPINDNALTRDLFKSMEEDGRLAIRRITQGVSHE